MRDIKFRGLASNKKFVYGWLVQNIKPVGERMITGTMEIHQPYGDWNEEFEVYDDTVGQFTGLTDCDGVEIFEGDILSVMVQELSYKLPKTGIKELDEYKPKKGEKFHTGEKIPAIWTIEHVNHLTYTGFKFYGLNRRFNKMATRSMIYNNQVKVIGNIHQNPELLERTHG